MSQSGTTLGVHQLHRQGQQRKSGSPGLSKSGQYIRDQRTALVQKDVSQPTTHGNSSAKEESFRGRSTSKKLLAPAVNLKGKTALLTAFASGNQILNALSRASSRDQRIGQGSHTRTLGSNGQIVLQGKSSPMLNGGDQAHVSQQRVLQALAMQAGKLRTLGGSKKQSREPSQKLKPRTPERTPPQKQAADPMRADREQGSYHTGHQSPPRMSKDSKKPTPNVNSAFLYYAKINKGEHCVQQMGPQTDGSPGADVNVKDSNGWTAMHHACWNQNPKLVNLLIYNCADINQKDTGGLTPLMLAITRGNASIATVDWF